MILQETGKPILQQIEEDTRLACFRTDVNESDQRQDGDFSLSLQYDFLQLDQDAQSLLSFSSLLTWKSCTRLTGARLLPSVTDCDSRRFLLRNLLRTKRYHVSNLS